MYENVVERVSRPLRELTRVHGNENNTTLKRRSGKTCDDYEKLKASCAS